MLQFFSKIHHFFGLAKALTDLTKKGCGIRKLDFHCDRSFRDLKKSIMSAPIFIPPNWDSPFRRHGDASQYGIDGTLTQMNSCDEEQVIGYTSRKLSKAELDYIANERKSLGIADGLNRFRCYLKASSFEVFTDNHGVSYFFANTHRNRRDGRWIDFLNSLTYRMEPQIPLELLSDSIH